MQVACCHVHSGWLVACCHVPRGWLDACCHVHRGSLVGCMLSRTWRLVGFIGRPLHSPSLFLSTRSSNPNASRSVADRPHARRRACGSRCDQQCRHRRLLCALSRKTTRSMFVVHILWNEKRSAVVAPRASLDLSRQRFSYQSVAWLAADSHRISDKLHHHTMRELMSMSCRLRRKE